MTTWTTEDRKNAESYTVNVPDYLSDYKIRLIIDKAMEAPEPEKEMNKLCLKIFGSYTLGRWVRKWQERLGLNLPINKKWRL